MDAQLAGLFGYSNWGSDLTVARNPNAPNPLSGKVAGLTIQQNNALGGLTNVVTRDT